MDDFTRESHATVCLGHMQVGAVALPEIFPVLEGQMVPSRTFPRWCTKGNSIHRLRKRSNGSTNSSGRNLRGYRKTLTLSRELASELSYLEQEAASVLVDGVIEELKEKYPDPSVSEYLEEVRHHILDNLDPFKEREGDRKINRNCGRPSMKPPGQKRSVPPVWSECDLAHGDEAESPVIFETTPTYANLFGTIQRAYDHAADGQAISWICAVGRCCVRTAAF